LNTCGILVELAGVEPASNKFVMVPFTCVAGAYVLACPAILCY